MAHTTAASSSCREHLQPTFASFDGLTPQTICNDLPQPPRDFVVVGASGQLQLRAKQQWRSLLTTSNEPMRCAILATRHRRAACAQ